MNTAPSPAGSGSPVANDAKPAPYASYFRPDRREDRARAERDAVRDFLHARARDGELSFSSPDDPPDVVGIDGLGQAYAFEVCDLNDASSIEAARAGKRLLRAWVRKDFTEGEFHRLVLKAIDRKREKVAGGRLRGGPYVSLVLLLTCSEPLVDLGDGSRFFTTLPAVDRGRFDEIWAIAPPAVDPSSSDGGRDNPCRVFRLA